MKRNGEGDTLAEFDGLDIPEAALLKVFPRLAGALRLWPEALRLAGDGKTPRAVRECALRTLLAAEQTLR